MKKLALVFLAAMSFAGAKAQFQFGIKAGANFSTLNSSDFNNTSTLIGFNGGVFAKLPIAHHWSLQPELVYSAQGTKYDDGAGGTGTEHLNYLNIPILLKYSHPVGFYFETGPQAGFLLSAHDNYQSVSADVKGFYKSSDWSWVFGVGYKIPMSPVGIDLRYNAGLTDVNDHYNSGTSSSIYTNVWQLGLTFALFSAPVR